MTTLDTPNPERNAEFEAWIASLPAKSWAKYDLSACRLGWDAALSSIPEQGVGVTGDAKEIADRLRNAAPKMDANWGRLALDASMMIEYLFGKAALTPSHPAAVGALEAAARDLIASRSDTYRAGNNRQVGIQDESGEKMWIVPFDEMAALEAALRSTP